MRKGVDTHLMGLGSWGFNGPFSDLRPTRGNPNLVMVVCGLSTWRVAGKERSFFTGFGLIGDLICGGGMRIAWSDDEVGPRVRDLQG